MDADSIRGARVAVLVATVAFGLASPTQAWATDPPPKREVPDYDGRGPEPRSAADGLLWIPRVVLSPLYVVNEFVLRRPLGWLATTAERDQWPGVVSNFFTFGEGGKTGIIPTFLIDFGFRPSFGLYFFADDAFGIDGHAIRLRAATGGERWFTVDFTDRWQLDRDGTEFFQWYVKWSRRPDWEFFGLGPNSRGADLARFLEDRVDGGLSFEGEGYRRSDWSFRTQLRYARFADETCCDDPSVGTVAAKDPTDDYEIPPRFNDGYTAWQTRLELQLDTRKRRPASGGGILLGAHGEVAVDVSDVSEGSWATFGAMAGAAVDLTGHNRELMLSAHLELSEPFGDQPVPFTEGAILGGDKPLDGFIDRRLLDRSSFSLRLAYQWPIWTWADGLLHDSLGNVFPGYLDTFHIEKLRVSFGLAVQSVGSKDHPFVLGLAFGTTPIDEGAEIDSIRFVLGTRTGF